MAHFQGGHEPMPASRIAGAPVGPEGDLRVPLRPDSRCQVPPEPPWRGHRPPTEARGDGRFPPRTNRYTWWINASTLTPGDVRVREPLRRAILTRPPASPGPAALDIVPWARVRRWPRRFAADFGQIAGDEAVACRLHAR